MDLRTPFLSPTAPRATMPALLIVMCLFATVPSTEAAPLASLPSFSSPSGILVAVLSVTVALSLVAGLVFVTKKTNWVKKLTNVLKITKKAKKEEEKVEQPRDANPPEPQEITQITQKTIAPKPSALVTEERISRVTYDDEVTVGWQFYKFIYNWESATLKEKEEFLIDMIREFPKKVTPRMAIDTLQIMLSEEVNPDLWVRMLRFILFLERDLSDGEKTKNLPPNLFNERFQIFLIAEAEKLLRKYGDVERPFEGGEAGFMRFVAYLLGFVCKDRRILKLMEQTWFRLGYRQTDASRAMVWGFRRWMDRPCSREQSSRRVTVIDDLGGTHKTFYNLMRELKETSPVPREDEGSRAQHLLFALGCGDEPHTNYKTVRDADPAQGPLAYICDTDCPEAEQFEGVDYLWLMLGRDLAAGNAWVWLCGVTIEDYMVWRPEHDRVCDRFGQDGKMYEEIVDTMMKYEHNYRYDGHNLSIFATRYSPDAAEKFNFDEHRAWFDRYSREKKTIRAAINTWLLENAKDKGLPPTRLGDPAAGVLLHYQSLAVVWKESEEVYTYAFQ